MPIVSVKNWPSQLNQLLCGYATGPSIIGAIGEDDKYKRKLNDFLRRIVVEAGIPGIDHPCLASVSFDSGHLPSLSADQEDDHICYIFVEGLRVGLKSDKNRRDFLAATLADGARIFLPAGWHVKVYVGRFNDAVESCTER